MATLSYNEAAGRQLKLRHLFFPGPYALTAEAVVGVLVLVFCNLSELNAQFFTKNFQSDNALPLWNHQIRRFLDRPENYKGAEEILLFMLWALIGAFVYVLAFRLIQAAFGVERAVGTGVRFVRQDHATGIVRWLASLHDFFLALIVLILGGSALAIGAVYCFGIASQELRDGLAAAFPDNAWPIVLSLLAAILSIRLIAIGLSLLSRRFRNWYTV